MASAESSDVSIVTELKQRNLCGVQKSRNNIQNKNIGTCPYSTVKNNLDVLQ